MDVENRCCVVRVGAAGLTGRFTYEQIGRSHDTSRLSQRMEQAVVGGRTLTKIFLLSQALRESFVQHREVAGAADLTLGAKQPLTHLVIVVVGGAWLSPYAIPRCLRRPGAVNRTRQDVARHPHGLASPVSAGRGDTGQQLDASSVQTLFHSLLLKDMDLTAITDGDGIASPVAGEGVAEDRTRYLDFQNRLTRAKRRTLNLRLGRFHADIEVGIMSDIRHTN